MRYRALVVDVDGTLLHSGNKRLGHEVAAALGRLQNRGVTVIVATGRAPHACDAQVLGGFVPHYRVCVNGACVRAADGETIHEDRFGLYEVEALTRYADERGYPVCFSFDDGYYAYTQYEQYLERYRAKWGDASHVLDGTSRRRHLEGMPFAAFALFPPQAAAGFMRAEPGLRLVEAASCAYDVCKAGMDKAHGLNVLLARLGIDWAEVVAVGDGDNDVAMLQRAGAGVAMGNAPPRVRQLAAHVAPPVRQDGVLWVADTFFK